MLVLALDTATPTVTAGVVELTSTGVVPRSVRIAQDSRKHGELLMPGVLAACADAGITLRDVEAVVTGVGPGPFTGLRVGMVSAAVLAHALGVPAYGVCSLDAVALGLLERTGTTVVATDARRREVYWAVYSDGEQIEGPHVGSPAGLLDRLPGLAADRVVGAGAVLYDLPGAVDAGPTAAGLVAAAGPALLDRWLPAPLRAAYLRRPDAVEMAARTPAGRP